MKADASTSHTPSGAGFGYRQFTQLLDAGKITVPLLARLHEDDGHEGLSIVAAALVRGQGKTEGLHRRAVRTFRMKELWEQGPVVAMDRVGDVARRRSDDAGEAARRLRRALMSLVQGGPDQARLDDDASKKKVEPWVERLEKKVDREFFEDAFWTDAADEDDPALHRLAWRQRLQTLAGQVFTEAAEAAPRTEMRRIRAIARARSMLDAQMAKWLKEVA